MHVPALIFALCLSIALYCSGELLWWLWRETRNNRRQSFAVAVMGCVSIFYILYGIYEILCDVAAGKYVAM